MHKSEDCLGIYGSLELVERRGTLGDNVVPRECGGKIVRVLVPTPEKMRVTNGPQNGLRSLIENRATSKKVTSLNELPGVGT